MFSFRCYLQIKRGLPQPRQAPPVLFFTDSYRAMLLAPDWRTYKVFLTDL